MNISVLGEREKRNMTAGGGFWASGAPGPSLQLDRSTGPSIAVDKGRLAHLPIREQR